MAAEQKPNTSCLIAIRDLHRTHNWLRMAPLARHHCALVEEEEPDLLPPRRAIAWQIGRRPHASHPSMRQKTTGETGGALGIATELLARFDEIAAKPILVEMRRQLLEEDVLQADETPIKAQLEDQRGTRRGTLWVWRNARGSPNEMSVADFKDDRSAKGPDAFLGDWTGKLLTDGYDGVNPTARQNAITRAGCWAHARRKFRDALTAGATRAGLALRPIQRLFWIERAVMARAENRSWDRDHSTTTVGAKPSVESRASQAV